MLQILRDNTGNFNFFVERSVIHFYANVSSLWSRQFFENHVYTKIFQVRFTWPGPSKSFTSTSNHASSVTVYLPGVVSSFSLAAKASASNATNGANLSIWEKKEQNLSKDAQLFNIEDEQSFQTR